MSLYWLFKKLFISLIGMQVGANGVLEIDGWKLYIDKNIANVSMPSSLGKYNKHSFWFRNLVPRVSHLRSKGR